LPWKPQFEQDQIRLDRLHLLDGIVPIYGKSRVKSLIVEEMSDGLNDVGIIIHDENSTFIYHLLFTIHEIQLSYARRLMGR
jgi:hypothetical protein